MNLGKHKEERTNGFQELQDDQDDVISGLGFVIFLQSFVKGTYGKHKEERRNGFQELQEDQEDALPSLGFVIFLQSFVK